VPLTAAEIRHEVLVVPRRAWLAVPDLRVIERAGWIQIITPSFTRGGNNEVVHAELPDDEADAVIDRTIAEYHALGVRWRWRVGPGSRPTDLAERLERRGFLRHDVAALARETGGTPAVPGIEVERVGARAVEEYTATFARGWEVDPGPLAAAHVHVATTPGGRHRLYLARIGGEPAGIATAAWFDRSSYLQNGVVLPRFQHRGVYRALVAARLAEAAAAGIPLATTNARPETSAPILERLGFSIVERFVSYSLPA
jgi:GNAT superfamily N-acetyltransferase